MHYTFDFMSVFVHWDRLLYGAWLTVQLSTLSIVLGFVVGTLCAIALKSKSILLQAVVKSYVKSSATRHCWYRCSWCISVWPASV